LACCGLLVAFSLVDPPAALLIFEPLSPPLTTFFSAAGKRDAPEGDVEPIFFLSLMGVADRVLLPAGDGA
jgi:hypothetical protein